MKLQLLKKMGLLYKTKPYFSDKQLSKNYKIHIRSKVEYCCPVSCFIDILNVLSPGQILVILTPKISIDDENYILELINWIDESLIRARLVNAMY